jgi:hypothetical protein
MLTCLSVLVTFMALVVATIFLKSAALVLPWTMGASLAAAIAAVSLHRLARRRRPRGAAPFGLLAFVLVWGFGYAAYALAPPKAGPAKQGLEALFALGEPNQADIEQMFPIHLGIWSVVVGLVVGMGLSRTPAPGSGAGKDVAWVEEVDRRH